MEAARVWIGSLVALAVAGVGYQGWKEASRLKPVARGNPAAEFRMKRYDGKGDVVLSELRGKVVMLDFWATWCPPCVKEMPRLRRLALEYEARGLVFVAANRDEPDTAPADVRMFIERVEPELARFTAFADDATSDRYRLRVLPTLYFIGRDGEILQSHLGEASEPDLRRWIERALQPASSQPAAPRPVSPSSSPPP